MQISEIFHSIQGEGRLAGYPSSFVRLAGCPLRCRWCDTAYAQRVDGAENMTVEQVVEQVVEHRCDYVVVTGGEPLIARELSKLLYRLKQAQKHITLETAAIEYRFIACDLVSISPKLANSTPQSVDSREIAAHNRLRLNIPAIQAYVDSYDTQLKFVIGEPADLKDIEHCLERLKNVKPENIMLMPQAQTQERYRRLAPEIAQLCIDHNYNFSPRLHIELWGEARRR